MTQIGRGLRGRCQETRGASKTTPPGAAPVGRRDHGWRVRGDAGGSQQDRCDDENSTALVSGRAISLAVLSWNRLDGPEMARRSRPGIRGNRFTAALGFCQSRSRCRLRAVEPRRVVGECKWKQSDLSLAENWPLSHQRRWSEGVPAWNQGHSAVPDFGSTRLCDKVRCKSLGNGILAR